MIKLEAPYPAIQTITVLPNPKFSDSEALTDEVNIKRSMSGTLYTYVKTKNNRRKLLLDFQLNQMKGLELKAFIRSYYLSKIRLTDHLNQIWIGYITSNPFEYTTSSDEQQTIQLEFEGCEI